MSGKCLLCGHETGERTEYMDNPEYSEVHKYSGPFYMEYTGWRYHPLCVQRVLDDPAGIISVNNMGPARVRLALLIERNLKEKRDEERRLARNRIRQNQDLIRQAHEAAAIRRHDLGQDKAPSHPVDIVEPPISRRKLITEPVDRYQLAQLDKAAEGLSEAEV